ncbi:MAG: hypothetical protein Q7T71_09515, partial [Herbiconiux sp.]|nr:hypothetical protein [Herbiconiux sp.]
MTELLPDVEAARRLRVDWYVADRHRRVVCNGQGETWKPFAKAHAKQVGASHTACGLPAMG